MDKIVPSDFISSSGEELLVALAEQLKLPLLQISHHLELVQRGGEFKPSHIEHIADMAMYVIDCYILSRQLTLSQTQLQLEPVAVSAVLERAAHRLNSIAREYDCNVEIELEGKYGPVMAHRQTLEASIVTLGYAFIEAQHTYDTGEKPLIILSAYKNRQTITTGVYARKSALTSGVFNRARMLYGRSKQTLPPFSHGSSASIFVADVLLGLMEHRLYVSHHNKLAGLATALTPNPQLKLV